MALYAANKRPVLSFDVPPAMLASVSIASEARRRQYFSRSFGEEWAHLLLDEGGMGKQRCALFCFRIDRRHEHQITPSSLTPLATI